MTIDHAGLVKPARWSLPGRALDRHLWRGALAVFPLWEGAGPFAWEAAGRIPGGNRATWLSSPNWGVGRAGVCSVHDGTAGLNVDAANTANVLKKPYPIAYEVLVEPTGNGSQNSTIFANDGDVTHYHGFTLQYTIADRFQLNIGDGNGSGSSNRRTWTTNSDTFAKDRIWHVIAVVRGTDSDDASLWVNGRPIALSPSSSESGQPAYSSNPAKIGADGGFGVNGEGFHGRIYFAAAYGREFTDAEARARARDPYRMIRPRGIARYSAVTSPPVGDSGKGSIVIAIAC